jgi:hypothetical protein
MEGIKFDAASLLVGAAAGLAAGGVLSYILARRSFNERLDAEVIAVKHHYQIRAETASARADAVERTVPAVGTRMDDSGTDGVAKLSLDFYGNPEDSLAVDDSEDELSEDAELESSDASLGISWPPAERDRTRPYVISDEEFAEGAQEGVHQCITVKWYDGDHVLIDSDEQPIPDIRRTTGPLSKKGFGGVSKDPNIRYVRNERLEVDFEICFDEGSYIQSVLGYGTASPRDRT